MPDQCCALSQAVTERKAARVLNNKSLRAALKLWLDPSTREQAVARFGAIGDWDVSRVTDMSDLLYCQSEFNEDLSRWDTARVESMSATFCGARSFNQPLEAWNKDLRV